MTEEDVRTFFEQVYAGEWKLIEERLTEDAVLDFAGKRFGGRFMGRRKVLVFLRQNQRLFKDGLKFTVHWVGLSGDRVVAEWTNKGTTKTGKPYSNRGVTIFRVKDGKIVEIQDHLDTELLNETWPG
jgi:ketosteroid isomerase-like protein